MAGTRGLTLTRLAVTNVDYQYLGAFRLRVEASNPRGGMDPNVFVYLRRPPDPVTGVEIDHFMTVASAVDMAEYPADAPDPDATFPLFRLSSVELDLRAVELAERAYAIIRRAVDVLLISLDKLEALTVVEVAECGAPPPARSDSLSASTSS